MIYAEIFNEELKEFAEVKKVSDLQVRKIKTFVKRKSLRALTKDIRNTVYDQGFYQIYHGLTEILIFDPGFERTDWRGYVISIDESIEERFKKLKRQYALKQLGI